MFAAYPSELQSDISKHVFHWANVFVPFSPKEWAGDEVDP